ncbi:MAG TPA: efflux RND transporter periplasmic adaptor subunit [Chloroflexota bacterium]
MAAIDTLIGRASARRIGGGGLVLVALVFAAAAVLGYLGYTRVAAPPAAPAVAGTPAVARRGTVAATVSATGSVIATRQSKLTLPVSGRLTELPVKLGDVVKADDVLAKVDTQPLEMKLAQAESALRTAQVKLAQLKAGARPEDVTAAEASVRSAEAKLTDVQAGSTQADLVQGQTQVESAAASVRSAQASLSKLRQGAAPADVASAEQAVQSAQSGLQKAELVLATAQAGPKPEDIRQAELAVEQAKTSLWSQQVSRDATCSRPSGGQCEAANAGIGSAELGVVKANEALAALKKGPDPTAVANAQADLASAKETLRSAQLKLEQVKAGPAAADLQQAQTNLETAQASQRAAAARLDALKQGAKPVDVEAAKSALVQAQQQLETKKNPNTVQDIQLADEAVKSAELGVKQAKIDLDGAVLRAPFAGTVATVAGNVGEQTAASTALVTLVDPSQMRVDVSVDETDIAHLAPGQRAEITFDALEGARFAGKVIAVAPTATVTQGVATYPVSVSIDNPGRTIPIGITANVAIVTTEKADVVLVPNRALKRQGRDQVVDVLVDGKTEARPVQTGLANDQVTEVIRGVEEGETVLIPATTAAQPRIGGFGGPGPGPAVAVKPGGGG